MLSSLSGSSGAYRHIVFADELRGPRRALNLAPGQPAAALALRQPRVRMPLAAEQARFVTWLFDRAGLDACCYREETLSRRLPACLRALRAGSLEEARGRIESAPRLLLNAIDAMLIGVTSFFRDRHVFDALAQRILPALLARQPAPLRIWSAGCADGAETWSLAMLLDQMGALHRVQLVGTDCRPTAVRTAASGAYDETDVPGVPIDLLHRYFGRINQRWQVRAPLRTRVSWRIADLLALAEPGRWDLILCRNLAMYLRPEVESRLWQRLYAGLSPGGFVVVGKAERPVGLPLRPVLPCIFRRDEG